jgi:hydroxyacylglutathione hydrolase
MELMAFCAGPVQTNVYLIWDAATLEAALIDPGMGSEDVAAEAARLRLRVKFIFNTHAHFDHTWLNAHYRRLWPDAKLIYHRLDEPLLDATAEVAAMYGFPIPEDSPHADEYCDEGSVYKLGGEELRILHLPGHSPGSIGVLTTLGIFSGDVLFQDGVGRTDLPCADEATLMRSIREKLFTLPKETVVFTGHGPSTTIGEEMSSNPFFD